MQERLTTSRTLSINVATHIIGALVVDHLFPRLCVNNLVQNRAINKFAREILATLLISLFHALSHAENTSLIGVR